MSFVDQEIVEAFPALQAHRGYHIHCAENTIEALQNAKSHGFQACEFDVRLSRDGVVVLQHDETLTRMHHDPRRVHQTSWDEMKSLGVNCLEDVLNSEDIPEFLNIEIKSESFADFSLEEAVQSLLQKVPHRKKIILSSFNPLSMMFFQHRLTSYPRALIVNGQKDEKNPIYLRQMWLDPLVDAQFLHLDWQSLDRRILFLNNARGRRVSVWTVNESKSAQEYLQMGVASVISDEVTPKDLSS